MESYVIRAVALKGYDETVTELGGDADLFYQAVGIDPVMLQNPEGFIPYESYLRLLNTAADTLACDDFGLRLSQKKDGTQFGILSLILETSPSILDALQAFSRFFRFQSRSATLRLIREGEFTFWKHTIHYQGDESLGQAYLNSMGVGSRILRLIGGNALKPISAYTIFDSDTSAHYVQRYNQCPVSSNAEFNGWKFRTQDLDRSRPGSNPALNQLLQDQIQTLLDGSAENFELRIKEVIRQALAIGDPSIDRVASYLSNNRRSFQRLLASHNLLHRDLLDDVRLEMAKHHLRYSNLPLTHIADMLCYTDLSSFSRFFTKNLGVTPSRWRKLY